MIRFLLAVAAGVLAAFLVASVYSPAHYRFWEQHDAVRGVIAYLGVPTVFLLGLVGVDLTTSARPQVIAAFIQWLAAGYLIGGVFFREKAPASLRGDLPHD